MDKIAKIACITRFSMTLFFHNVSGFKNYTGH